MAGLTDIHASTQDATAGTLVTTINNEAGSGAGAIQAVAPVGNKSTFPAVVRSAITAADSVIPTTSLVVAQNAMSVEVYASCTTYNATLTGVVLFYDVNGNFQSFSEQLAFTGNQTMTLSSTYYCERQIVDCGSAVSLYFFVSSVSAGTWSVTIQPI